MRRLMVKFMFWCIMYETESVSVSVRAWRWREIPVPAGNQMLAVQNVVYYFTDSAMDNYKMMREGMFTPITLLIITIHLLKQ
jgi:hypothetical protein